ncbi:hypothetical protein AVEN_159440-1 [Araneus ventricosus]|uniref:Uncharacterized protein n=1 Tax=Araneus ventricosus TaxID=182803 RepID=A0A4Y2A110_ARAVE|nr:hypothetical protein AVEN_159440-1 [Araneus ventricosus]
MLRAEQMTAVDKESLWGANADSFFKSSGPTSGKILARYQTEGGMLKGTVRGNQAQRTVIPIKIQFPSFANQFRSHSSFKNGPIEETVMSLHDGAHFKVGRLRKQDLNPR